MKKVLNTSLDVIPQMQIGLRVSWKLCLNLSSRRWLRPNLNLVINLIPLGLWRLIMEFEDGLINFKIFFLKAKKVSEFLIFKSKLFHSVTVDGKKIIPKKICLPLKRGMLLLVFVLYALLSAGSILKRCSGDWPYFEKVAEFSIPSSFKRWF